MVGYVVLHVSNNGVYDAHGIGVLSLIGEERMVSDDY